MSTDRDHRHRRASRLRRDPDPGGARLPRRAATTGSPARRVAAAGRAGGAGGPDSRRARPATSCRRPRTIRDDPTWRVPPPAPGLVDRRVEITGPTDRKMTINALNSGAKVWLADFEDATSPDLGQRRSTASSTCSTRSDGSSTSPSPDGKRYARRRATRRRSWSGRAAGTWSRSTSCDRRPARSRRRLVDFGLYFFHNAQRADRRAAAARTSTCRSWRATSRRGCGTTSSSSPRSYLGIPHGTIRATVLIETITAAFEMDEILYELRDHCAGPQRRPLGLHLQHHQELRRGRDFVLPDRAEVTMTVPFMRAYTELLVQTCHKRGAHAIGGMGAFIPSRDPEVTERGARRRSRADKRARGRRRVRRHLGGAPRPVATCRERVRRGARRPAEPGRPAARRRDGHRRRPARRRPDAGSTVTEVGAAHQRRGRAALHRRPGCAARGAAAHRRPHGGRRHRRDLRAPRSGSGCTTGTPTDYGGAGHGRPGAVHRGRARRPGRSAAAGGRHGGASSWSTALAEDLPAFFTPGRVRRAPRRDRLTRGDGSARRRRGGVASQGQPSTPVSSRATSTRPATVSVQSSATRIRRMSMPFTVGLPAGWTGRGRVGRCRGRAGRGRSERRSRRPR